MEISNRNLLTPLTKSEINSLTPNEAREYMHAQYAAAVNSVESSIRLVENEMTVDDDKSLLKLKQKLIAMLSVLNSVDTALYWQVDESSIASADQPDLHQGSEAVLVSETDSAPE